MNLNLINRAIKIAIQTVYTQPISQVFNVQNNPDGSFKGKFKDGSEVFDFDITSNGLITYVEDESRSDTKRSTTARKKKCTEGKPCGDTCISKGDKCRRQLPGNGMKALRVAQSQVRVGAPVVGIAASKAAALAAGALAVGAGAIVANSPDTQAFIKSQLNAIKNNANNPRAWDISPQQNQFYDPSLPTDAQIKKAKFESLNPVTSGATQTGTHKIQKMKVGQSRFFSKSSDFFTKEAYELAAAKEVSSYEIAQHLGLGNNVLPVRKFYRDGKPHILTPLLNQDDIKDLGNDQNIAEALKQMPREKLEKALLFDYITHQKDRHSGNVLIKKDGDMLLIDHGAVRWDLNHKISSTLETKKSVFYKALGSDPEARLSAEEINNVLNNRDKIKETMKYRYAGMTRINHDPIMEKLDDRFDVLQSMKDSGDTRISNLIKGTGVKLTNKTQVFDKTPLPNTSINGIKLESSDPNFYEKVADNLTFNEPPFPKNTGEQKAGAIVMEPDGRTWLYEPTNHYAGTINAFAKGGVEAGLSLQQNALKEVREELGLQVKIIDHLGDFNHKNGQKYKPTDDVQGATVNRYYMAVRTGGTPADAHWEADKVKLATTDDAAKLLNKIRDQKILGEIGKYTTSDKGIGKLKQAYQEHFFPAKGEWKPKMTRAAAEEWSKNSAIKDSLWHVTDRTTAVPGIAAEGFRLSLRKVGRAYGNGVYLGTDPAEINRTYGGPGKSYPDPGTLELKVNLAKVLDIEAERKKYQRRAGIGSFPINSGFKPQVMMGKIAQNLGQGQQYKETVERIRRKNEKLNAQLRDKKITQEQFNMSYADNPESEAMTYIAQRSGYEGLKLRGGRGKVSTVVVYEPKNIVVVDKDYSKNQY